ncbi:hypothetical protein [Brevibacillus reuszeri]|uniref:hypothetical protein n=1 Tax=Brevibacillus reuszeri TaxID=54915 RepID=UPI0013DF5AB3|nr:hypothetical protein [Brevibacillus reuszeri]
MNQMEVSMCIKTEKGRIEIKKSNEADYPGFWIEVNGEGLVHVEYDSSNECHVIRTYSFGKEEPVYTQKVFATDQEIELLWEELENITFHENEGELFLVSAWRMFESGTSREEIWKWFDNQHTKGVAWLLHEYRWSDGRDE